MTLTSQFCKCFVTWCVGRHTEPGKCQGDVFLELAASSGPIKKPSGPQTRVTNMLISNPFWMNAHLWMGWGAIRQFIANSKIKAIESYWSHYKLVQNWQHLFLWKGLYMNVNIRRYIWSEILMMIDGGGIGIWKVN